MSDVISIQAHTEALLKDFTEKWGSLLDVAPSLNLDENWPSVGIIDLLTFSLRLEETIDSEVDGLLKGSAAYLAKIVANSWSRIVEKIEIGDGPEGIFVRAEGGEFIPEGEEVHVALEREFRNCLRTMPYPLPILRNKAKPVSFDSNIISNFTLSVASGLSPHVKGAWEEKDTQSFGKALLEITKTLALQSSQYYATTFPDEPFGQMAELYLNDLIYPPLLIGEALPTQNASQKLLSYFREYDVPEKTMIQIAKNLAQSPDETISCVGLVFYIALETEECDPQMLAIAESKGRFIGLLRHSIQEVRAQVKETKDWVVHGFEDNEGSEKHFEVEYAMRCIPWLYLSKDYLVAARPNYLLDLLIPLCAFDLPASVAAADALIQENPKDIELRLQRINLEMVSGNTEKIADLFSSLLSEHDADKSPRFFSLWGQFMLHNGEAGSAEKYFRAALSLENNDDDLYADIANSLAWSSTCRHQYEATIEFCDKGLSRSRFPATLLLNKAHALWSLKRFEEANSIRKKLFRMVPCDRRVFGSIGFTGNLENLKD